MRARERGGRPVISEELRDTQLEPEVKSLVCRGTIRGTENICSTGSTQVNTEQRML